MTTRDELRAGWTVRLGEGADLDLVPEEVRTALPVPATVPGTVHTDLLAAGLLPDPYLDRNEDLVQWVGQVPWVYECTLAYEPRAGEQVLLHFDGLDTVATVRLNGEPLARTVNMHRRYDVPVTGRLHPGSNRLSVRFEPAEAFAAAERDRLGALPAQLPAPFNFIRKMACNFGWDWGPSLVTAGIWRPVTLIRHTGPRLDRVLPAITLHGAHGVATFAVRFDRPLAQAATIEAQVGDVRVRQPVAAGCLETTVVVRVPEPALWWPRGFGEPALHEAAVRLFTADDAPVDEWTERIGFRSVRLDTTPDAEGTPFVLVVNDVPVPVRGVNWIPDDCFPSRVGPDRIAARLDQAVAANVNLVRVWGGGVYESHEFYRACDERGVLVWQDFLFACAAYPEDPGTVAEVTAEAADNVERLASHPSLVLWNGNNENLWGHEDWGWRDAIAGRPWGLGYYLGVLPEVVHGIDPTRPYWPGSPFSGAPDVHPNHDDHGPKHVWDVWNERDYTAYREHEPRFAAEFGWQGPPAWSTLTRAVHDDPLTPDSPGIVHHQKAEDGSGKLARGLAPHFPEPAGITDWHFATQLNQARAIRVGVEHFRSLRPRCTGTILWQLNDCWPVTSWAVIDGDGTRKPAWYALRAAYTPRLLTVQPRAGGLALIAVNDLREAWDTSITVRRMTFTGQVRAEHTARLSVDPLGAATVEVPAACGTPESSAREVLVIEAAQARALWFFAEDRDLVYSPDALEASVHRDPADPGVVVVTVRARSLVRDLCVFPDRIDPAAEASDSVLTLLPGEQTELRVHGVPAGREEELVAAPVLRSAADLVVGNREPVA